MRVLLITPSPPQPRARAAVPLVSWAQLEGVREGNHVTLVTTAGPDLAEWQAVQDLRDAGVDVRAHRRADVDVGDRATRWARNAGRWLVTGRPMYTLWHYEPQLQHMIDRLLTHERFDVVHVNDTAAACYNLATDAPKLLVENEVRAPRPVDLVGWTRGNWYRGILDEADWYRWQSYHRRTWRRFDRIEVFTERDASLAKQLSPGTASRIHVNPFGMEMPRAADPLLEEEGTVAFVGGFLHEPNVDAARWLALEIMPRLRARLPSARLRIFGSDPRGSLLGLEGDGVEVSGWAPDIESVVERAAVIVAPVRIGGGQRMKVLHAMGMGKAVVTTPRGVEGLLGENGDEPPLLSGSTADEIADLTAQLLRDPVRRHALGVLARATVVKQHDVRAYGLRINAAYAALSEQRRAAPATSAR